MKKTILTSAIALILSFSAFAQPVSDRAVVPVAVTLNQILRIHVINGGNIEFVFNNMNDYKNGIANTGAGGVYSTDVVVASSTNWEMNFGADVLFTATDDATLAAGLLALNNIGFMVANTGANTMLAVVGGNSIINNNALTVFNGLGLYGAVASQSPMISPSTLNNAGDINDNAFSILWQCGITPAVGVGTNPVNGTSILSQNVPADRYTTNVFLDINGL